jgi:hypothetical protein
VENYNRPVSAKKDRKYLEPLPKDWMYECHFLKKFENFTIFNIVFAP